jgi:biotin synthase
MKKEALHKILRLPLDRLIALANKTRREFLGDKIELCSIINAKSGSCNQDCKFCAQSRLHKTHIEVYALKSKKEIVAQALRAQDIGAERFGIVTSGNRLSADELKRVCEAASEIKKKLVIKLCVSLGSIGEEGLRLLKEAGVSRYHHNIETSGRYFPRIATTHSFADRINTIRRAKDLGFEVCSGGIIGMGESMQDRLEMAFCLKELNVDAVPINILVPIKGTRLEKKHPISCVEVIRTIAIFRIVLKDKIIKIAAGRESALKDFTALAFLAGADGMLIGGYLTIKGRAAAEDHQLVKEIKKLWMK